MPRGGNNKKKKGRKIKQGRNVGPGKDDRPSSTNCSSQGFAKPPPTESVPAIFETFQHRRGKILPDNYRTVYSRYKAATKRVFDYLQKYAGEKNHHLSQVDEPAIMNVNSLVLAADWMAEAKIPVDPDILKDLKFSIRVRSKVARSVYGGGDAGHQHLLDTLVYCWKVLDSLPREARKNTVEEQEELENHGEGCSRNHFEALHEIDELEEEDDDSAVDEEIFSSKDVHRPTLDAESITLQDLLDAEDRMDARLFLITLDAFMRCVAEDHAHVTKVANMIAKVGEGWSGIIPALLGATITTNMAIQRVQRLEIEFELQNPHINTPYRLLSLIIYPVMIRDVVQITREHGQKQCSPRDANAFVGDCLECSFRVKSKPEGKNAEIISNFCSRFEIDSEGSQSIVTAFNIIRCMTVYEVPLGRELEIALRSEETSPHSWLLPFDFIGGDRAIHHTFRLLQWYGCYAEAASICTGAKPKNGFFGSSPWQPGRSNKIHNDLDELLMADILPSWFTICRDWILNDETVLSRQSELAPFWGCIRRFVRSPKKAVKWSTCFAVHAMLTAILETDKISNKVAAVCQQAFDLYFDQLDIACEHKKGMDGSCDSPLFQPGMSLLRCFKSLGDPIFGPRALWNPLCGGSFLLFLNYQGNIEYGTRLIDDRAQLKIVLHLYHALIVNDILNREDIPFLDELYRGFEKSKELWGGSLPPRKGKLVEQFWISMRGRLKVCEKVMAKLSHLGGTKLSNQHHIEMIKLLCSSEPRVMTGELNPEEISTSFRRICNHDYHDVVDKYHSKEMRRKSSGSDSYAFIVQANDTYDAFFDEHPLFAYNLPACGVYLDEFVSGMSRFFQWDQLFKEEGLRSQNTQLQHAERIVEEYMFAHSLLGALDQAEDPSELDRIRDFVTVFMFPFFTKLSGEKTTCIWFQEMSSR